MNPEKIKSWIWLLGTVSAVSFWCFTIYGLPPRVDKLEQKVASHDERLTRSDVKMDIVVDDVKIIKSILMQSVRQ